MRRSLRDRLPKIIRQPVPPAGFREEFRREVTFSNSRRLKPITWLLLSGLAFFMVADYVTIRRSGLPEAREMWIVILGLRIFAMAACAGFLRLFGPMRSVDDVRPRHHWVWQAYIYFFLAYTALIVGYMFPVKESIGPIYIFLLGPSAFIAMTTGQVTLLLAIGLTTVAGALHAFVPGAATARFHLINAFIISWVSFVVAHVTYRATYRDFMNRKVIERKNRELEEARAAAEQASQAKSDFLAAISHEIRTPMNAILGMTEVALHSPLSGEQRDCIETARESGLHLLDVINDILDFSSIEARKLRLAASHFDLPAVIHSAMKTVRLQARRKGVELDMEIMAGTPRFLFGDPGRLRQVLINLLGNAAKFTDRGDIRVTVGPWRDAPADPDRPLALAFSVRDTGPGVDMALADTLFEPFTQGDNSASRSYGGSGLGLAICKNLVSLMGGAIRVDSRPGKGSEFSFTARFAESGPARAGGAGTPAAAPAEALSVAPARVLLVDDNPLNVKVEKILLDRMGMTTTVAGSGAEALLLLAEQEFDVVLLDLEMPGMDGHETARRIRSGEGGGRPVRQPGVPILAVTAHALAEVRQRCERGRMDGFLTKPAGFGELAAALRLIVGGRCAGERPAPPPEPEAAAVLDMDAAARTLGVSRAEVLHLLPGAMAEIGHKLALAEQGMAGGLLREVTLQAHTLKSVAATVGAEATRQAAIRLENAARKEDSARSGERLDQLRREVRRLEEAAGKP
ncbi:ATP-binding protein [Pseudodesulfovibrio sp.]|uniref:ATP-binding protein n=1 Tax=Pseudodesulfovibrio sp. TaxID=2035812 RepID=UPI00260DA0D0|nr:ATP-binding protein [Pseudodesulfovibrio sp.]MDD3312073.1 ATP-binding protein [Pseudodesulfovibrio sp.]